MKGKVLLVTNIFLPAIGGPATFAARLAQRLIDNDYEARIFCATAAPPGSDDRFPFKVTRAGFTGNRLRREIEVRVRLLAAVMRADLVYCMGLEHQAHWALRAARKRYTIRIGGDSVWERARNLGVTCLEPGPFYEDTTLDDRVAVSVEEGRRRSQLRDASAIIYVSEYLRNLASIWTHHRAPAEYVVPNGIEPGPVLPATCREKEQALRVLFVGRQTNWKGVDAALLAVSRVGNTKLTIAGSGPAWPAHVNLARRLGVSERTRFLSRVDSRDIVDVMREHHVLVLPSLYEGMSNTLLEAGTAGIACVASNRGGNPEVIENGVNGILVDPFDVEALCEALTALRDNDNVRMELAERHRQRVREEFQISYSVQQTIRILQGEAVYH